MHIFFWQDFGIKVAEGFKRIEYDEDPNRCQGVTAQGQCRNIAVEHGTHCMAHGGNMQKRAHEKKELNNYRLTKWQARVQRMESSPNIKSIRDELAILRMILEEKLNSINDENDLLNEASQISDLILKIEKLVTSCHKLESSMGQLLDKPAILNFAAEIIRIVSDCVDDEIKTGIIANKILELIGRATNESIHD